MKRFLCFFFAFLTVFSLCVPTMAVNLDDLPALDMDNTSIEYDFERVFLKEYSVNDYFENPLKTQPELITMAEKGFNEYSYNLFNEELMLESSNIKKADVGYEVNEYFNSFSSNNFLVKHLKAVIKP
ncbi:MAG: hypothetical protein J6A53_02595, partial [Clostridia bacterium]|nr:hypothetical protein [Clostridia bacterium]